MTGVDVTLTGIVLNSVSSVPDPEEWQYWLPRWVARKSPSTQRVYADAIREFLDFIAWKPIRFVTTLDIEAFQQLVVNAGKRPNTVSRKVATACSLVSYIHKRDLSIMPQNVGAAVERIKTPNELSGRILSESEVAKIFDGERNPRNLALLRLLYNSGARISEALGLKWGDVLWEEHRKSITILGKGGKVRTINLYGTAIEALAAIRPAEEIDPSQYVFRTPHGRLERFYAVQIIRRAANRAGIMKKVSPLWFRHSLATHSLDRGCSLSLVSATLGHANLAVTGKYIHCRPGESAGKFLAV